MSKIEWTDVTWNPVTGCTKVSAGCKHCYAERFAKRMAGRFGYPKDDPFKLTLHGDRLNEPLNWKKPRMVFVNSMSDLFHEEVPAEYIATIFEVMSACPQHIFQILTKRPKNMCAWLLDRLLSSRCIKIANASTSNIWLGTSCEDQKNHDARGPWLYRTAAGVKFFSLEPLLEPIKVNLKAIAWVIVGGESGPGARPMELDWARSIRDQCSEAGVPFFMKQICNERGHKVPFDEWPDDLKIREFPRSVA